MLKDITLGQYFPGKSVLHRLDPRLKVILMLLFVAVVFFAKNLLSFLYLIVFLIVLTLISGIRFRAIRAGLKPILFIAAFTALINLFWSTGDNLLFSFWVVKIYEEGVWRALFMVLRILALVTGTSLLLTYTTTPMDLTDALESLLSPLKVIHLPVHEFAMMMSLALRFVPTLVEETEKIINAQKVRGADFETGSILRRAKALVPILIPLFVSAFTRASDLAVAMECRCYTGGEGRTRMNALHFTGKDFAVGAVLVLCFAVVIVLAYVPIPLGITL